MALSLVAVVAVSLPAAVPVLAAPGDVVKLIAPTTSVGPGGIAPAGSNFNVTVAVDHVTDLSGAQTALTFNNTQLNITSIAWGTGANSFAASTIQTPPTFPQATLDGYNAAGDTGPISANGFGAAEPAGAGVTNRTFITVGFHLLACPAGANVIIGQAVSAGGAQLFDSNGAAFNPTASGATVPCDPPQPNDFSISASPSSLNIAQGANGSTTVQVTKTTGNAQAVALGIDPATPLPSGITVNPLGSVTGTGSVTATFTVGAAVTPAVYIVKIQGVGPDATHSTSNITINVVFPSGGPTDATGGTTVTGNLDGGFIAVSVLPQTALTLKRNQENSTTVPVLVYANTQWTLLIDDSMLGGKAAANRGHMTGTLPPSPALKVLAAPMRAQVGVGPVRTLDVPAGNLTGGQLNATVNVKLMQLTQPVDPPANYSIDLTFSAISGF